LPKNNTTTRLTFLAAKGGFRYLNRVASGRSRDQQLATLGHEMQHAVVIADDFFFESPRR
jgi:hypothetical protein